MSRRIVLWMLVAPLCLWGCKEKKSSENASQQSGSKTAGNHEGDLPTGSSVQEWNEATWQARPCNGEDVRCVDAQARSGGDGSTGAPFASLTAAIASAKPGSTILVAEGVYPEAIAPKVALRIYGGFPSKGDFQWRDPAAHTTTIDATGKASSAVALTADASAIDGFHITGGTGSCDEWHCLGGGVYVEAKQHSVVRNCHIYANKVEHKENNGARGGGVWASGPVLIEDNHIRNNRAERGGGVFGEGITLRGNRVEGNEAYGDHGGGVAVFGAGNELIANHIVGNTVGKELGYGWGGGVLISSVGTTFRTEANVVTDNHAPSGFSGIFVDDGARGSMKNDLLFANRCGEKGAGALSIDALDETGATGSIVHAHHLTIADNRCKGGRGNAVWIQGKGSELLLENSILWNNGDAVENLQSRAKLTIRHSLSEEEGEGNFHEDPLFIGGGDYHLRSQAGHVAADGSWTLDKNTSPAVDAAAPSAAFDKEPAPNGARANLGAYGNTSEASRTPGS